MDLVKIVADGVMTAAVKILHSRDLSAEDCIDDLVAALRKETKEAYHEIVKLGKEAKEAAVSDAWLRAGVNAECVAAGKRAVDSVFGERVSA